MQKGHRGKVRQLQKKKKKKQERNHTTSTNHPGFQIQHENQAHQLNLCNQWTSLSGSSEGSAPSPICSLSAPLPRCLGLQTDRSPQAWHQVQPPWWGHLHFKHLADADIESDLQLAGPEGRDWPCVNHWSSLFYDLSWGSVCTFMFPVIRHQERSCSFPTTSYTLNTLCLWNELINLEAEH